MDDDAPFRQDVLRATHRAAAGLPARLEGAVWCGLRGTCDGAVQAQTKHAWHRLRDRVPPQVLTAREPVHSGIRRAGDQTLFMRSMDFQAAGGFDERLAIMEDVDLLMRLHRQGTCERPSRVRAALE